MLWLLIRRPDDERVVAAVQQFADEQFTAATQDDPLLAGWKYACWYRRDHEWAPIELITGEVIGEICVRVGPEYDDARYGPGTCLVRIDKAWLRAADYA